MRTRGSLRGLNHESECDLEVRGFDLRPNQLDVSMCWTFAETFGRKHVRCALIFQVRRTGSLLTNSAGSTFQQYAKKKLTASMQTLSECQFPLSPFFSLAQNVLNQPLDYTSCSLVVDYSPSDQPKEPRSFQQSFIWQMPTLDCYWPQTSHVMVGKYFPRHQQYIPWPNHNQLKP